MERLGDILERVLKEDYLDGDDKTNKEEHIIEDIVSLEDKIKKEIDNVKDIKVDNKTNENEILSYIADLLVDYGEFKRIPEYYKIIDGQSQDYEFIVDVNNYEVKGFKIASKNIRKGQRFVTEELYILESGEFCKFTSESINKGYYKECFRVFEYDMVDPTIEWGFYTISHRVITILSARLHHMEEIGNREKILNRFLNEWSKNLKDIINM